MKIQSRRFHKKYCRVAGRNIVIEEIKKDGEVKWQCYDKKNCKEKECCLKHILQTVSSGV